MQVWYQPKWHLDIEEQRQAKVRAAQAPPPVAVVPKVVPQTQVEELASTKKSKTESWLTRGPRQIEGLAPPPVLLLHVTLTNHLFVSHKRTFTKIVPQTQVEELASTKKSKTESWLTRGPRQIEGLAPPPVFLLHVTLTNHLFKL